MIAALGLLSARARHLRPASEGVVRGLELPVRGSIFSAKQRRALTLIAIKPRIYEATSPTYLLLERKGFVQRVKAPFNCDQRGYLVNEWMITEEGRRMLADP